MKSCNGVGNEIIYHAELLKSVLCDYNNAYILVRGSVTVIGNNVIQAALKNCALFVQSSQNWWNNNRRWWRLRFTHDVV